MAASTTSGLQLAAARVGIASSSSLPRMRMFTVAAAATPLLEIGISSLISSLGALRERRPLATAKYCNVVTRAMSGVSEKGNTNGLPIDLRGKRAFIEGIADDNGYGWAIAKALASAGAEILVSTWVPALNIFETSLRRGKFDESLRLPNGSLMEITKVYPLDAVYDSPEDVPEDVRTNKRYLSSS